MTAEQLSVKNKLLVAAIECIEKEGIHNISVRKICSAAGVNVASVNYYFHSKEEMLEEALRLSLKNGFDDLLEELKTVKQERGAATEYLLSFFMEGAIKWPGITKAHLYKPWNNDYENLFVEKFNSFLLGLYKQFSPLYPDKSESELKQYIIQIISAVMFPALMPELFTKFSKLNFKKESSRKKYIDNLLINVIKGS